MKKWKIIVSIFVLLLAAGAGSVYYFLNIKEYKTADKKVDEIVKSDFNIKLPDASSGVETAQPEGTAQTAETAEPKKAGADTDSAEGSGSDNSSNKDADVQKVKKLTAAQIIAKYQPAFKDLESQADSKLNSLLSYAYSEYQTKKANGEEISYFYFYSKYNGAAQSLEASTDNSFNYIYSALTKELVNSGYSASDAKSIKDHYVSVKKQRRSSIMNQAVSHLK